MIWDGGSTRSGQMGWVICPRFRNLKITYMQEPHRTPNKCGLMSLLTQSTMLFAWCITYLVVVITTTDTTSLHLRSATFGIVLKREAPKTLTDFNVLLPMHILRQY